MSQTSFIFSSFYKAKMPGSSIQNNMCASHMNMDVLGVFEKVLHGNYRWLNSDRIKMSPLQKDILVLLGWFVSWSMKLLTHFIIFQVKIFEK